VELKELRAGPVDGGWSLSGRSRVIAGDPYTLTSGFPPGGSGTALTDVTARGEDGPVSASFETHLGYATVRVDSDATQDVSWEMTFAGSDNWKYPPRRPEGLEASMGEDGRVGLSWRAEYYSIGGYQVEVDGVPVGVAFEPRAFLSDLEGGRTYTLGVREVWYDGTVGDEVTEIDWTVPR
jgi:hypothetical protein